MTDKLWGMHRMYQERINDLLQVYLAIQTLKSEQKLYRAVRANKKYAHAPKA